MAKRVAKNINQGWTLTRAGQREVKSLLRELAVAISSDAGETTGNRRLARVTLSVSFDQLSPAAVRAQYPNNNHAGSPVLGELLRYGGANWYWVLRQGLQAQTSGQTTIVWMGEHLTGDALMEVENSRTQRPRSGPGVRRRTAQPQAA